MSSRSSSPIVDPLQGDAAADRHRQHRQTTRWAPMALSVGLIELEELGERLGIEAANVKRHG